MVESSLLLLAALAGILLGTFFFGGLWWTVRTQLSSEWLAAWLLGGLILRTAITLAGFFFVGSGDWRRLLACLLGFFLARLLVMRLTRTMEGAQHETKPMSLNP
jgi:F1F0 ATPase subunit 2